MIEEKLDELAELWNRIDGLRQKYDERRDAILAPVQDQLLVLAAECEPELDEARDQADILQLQVKALVTAHGKTVKGKQIMAVWSKGRVSWDSRRLDGYAAAHPELNAFRSEGEPTVSIRRVSA